MGTERMVSMSEPDLPDFPDSRIDVENRASARVAERCGYVLEGVMRSSYLKDDVRVNAGLWSRLPTDR